MTARLCLVAITAVFLVSGLADSPPNVVGKDGSNGAGSQRELSEDDAYEPDDDHESLNAYLSATHLEFEPEPFDPAYPFDPIPQEAVPEGGGGEIGEGDSEAAPMNEAAKAIYEVTRNKTHLAMMKVVALSWPSEGKFGEKVATSLKHTGSAFSFGRAERKAFRILTQIERETAKMPSEEILLALGYRYWHGIGTRRDCAAALSCYNAVSGTVARYMEQMDGRELKLDLGLMRISLSEVDGVLGEDFPEDAEALEFDKLNAQAGDLWAQKEMGWRSLVGKGLEENHAHAQANLEAAAAGGDFDAQHNLGYMYMNGLGVERNYTQAKVHFDEAAKGNVTAAFNALGFMYSRGMGVQKNLTEGERYLKMAAQMDDADAAFNLAALYQEMDRNMTRAFPLLEQASESGYWRAHLAVAQAYEHGIGKPRNCTAALVPLKKLTDMFGGVARELRDGVALYKEGKMHDAMKIFCDLAEQGVEVAQSNCAWMHLKGKGVRSPVNMTLRYLAARKMFALGGQQGGADSHLRLGDMNWYGQGGEPNITAAAEHYQIAAARRSYQACFALGYMHHFGIGVEQDFKLARKFYYRSGPTDHFTRVPAILAITLVDAQRHTAEILDFIKAQDLTKQILGHEFLNSFESKQMSFPIMCTTLSACLLIPMLIGMISLGRRTGQEERQRRRVPEVAEYLNQVVD